MDWVTYGKFGRTHGLKGALKFYPFHFNLETCQGIRNVRVEFPDGPREEEVESVRGHRPPFILKLKRLQSIEEAEVYQGVEIKAHREDFPDSPEGKPYWFDIEGLKAYDEDGQFYGLVEEVLQTGSNDVYVVRKGGQELLLPAIDWVILKIDIENRILIFRIVDGLLDANAI